MIQWDCLNIKHNFWYLFILQYVGVTLCFHLVFSMCTKYDGIKHFTIKGKPFLFSFYFFPFKFCCCCCWYSRLLSGKYYVLSFYIMTHKDKLSGFRTTYLKLISKINRFNALIKYFILSYDANCIIVSLWFHFPNIMTSKWYETLVNTWC